MKHIELACYLIQKPNILPHVLEFGVYKGMSLTRIKEKIGLYGYELFGFDSFEGLPEDWFNSIEDEVVLEKGFFSLQEGENLKFVMDGVNLYTGWFKDTIPDYLKIAKPIALLHID